jgi:hypothetical protein
MHDHDRDDGHDYSLVMVVSSAVGDKTAAGGE